MKSDGLKRTLFAAAACTLWGGLVLAGAQALDLKRLAANHVQWFDWPVDVPKHRLGRFEVAVGAWLDPLQARFNALLNEPPERQRLAHLLDTVVRLGESSLRLAGKWNVLVSVPRLLNPRAEAAGLQWVRVAGGWLVEPPAGGEAADRRAHWEAPFDLSRTEVTVAQFAACVEAGPCMWPKVSVYERCNWRPPIWREGPMNCISHGEAQAFARWAGGHLPTVQQHRRAMDGGPTPIPVGILTDWFVDPGPCTDGMCLRNAAAASARRDGGAMTSARRVAACDGAAGVGSGGLCGLWDAFAEWTLDAEPAPPPPPRKGLRERRLVLTIGGELVPKARASARADVGFRLARPLDEAVESAADVAERERRLALRAREMRAALLAVLGLLDAAPAQRSSWRGAAQRLWHDVALRAEVHEGPHWRSVAMPEAVALRARLGRTLPLPTRRFAGGAFDPLPGYAPALPIPPVPLLPFELGTRLVTKGEYDRCARLGFCQPLKLSHGCNRSPQLEPNRPARCVSHGQAEAYARWLGARLPTSAEWASAVELAGSECGPVSASLDAPSTQARRSLARAAAAQPFWPLGDALPPLPCDFGRALLEWVRLDRGAVPGPAPAAGDWAESPVLTHALAGGGWSIPPDQRARWRRYRPKPTDQMEIGFRLATGGSFRPEGGPAFPALRGVLAATTVYAERIAAGLLLSALQVQRHLHGLILRGRLMPPTVWGEVAFQWDSIRLASALGALNATVTEPELAANRPFPSPSSPPTPGVGALRARWALARLSELLAAVPKGPTAHAQVAAILGGAPIAAQAFGDDEPWALGRTEVTVAQYGHCIAAGVCSPPHYDDCLLRIDPRFERGAVPPDHPLRRPDHPVVCVDWQQARAYAEWVGGQLPTETQWYLAATRATDRRARGPLPDDPTCAEAILPRDERGSCQFDATEPTCSRLEGITTEGLCDLVGNVWEWSARDTYDPNLYRAGCGNGGSRAEESAPHQQVLGGGWHGAWSGAVMDGSSLPQDQAAAMVGFRVAWGKHPSRSPWLKRPFLNPFGRSSAPPARPGTPPLLHEHTLARLLRLPHPLPPTPRPDGREPPLSADHPLHGAPITWIAIPEGQLSAATRSTFSITPAGTMTAAGSLDFERWPLSMGPGARRPLHVDGFEVSRAEITEAQYSACVATGACPALGEGACQRAPATIVDVDAFRGPLRDRVPFLHLGFRPERRPQTCVNWHEAQAFAVWAGGRLPTETEWVHTSRSGGLTHPYPWGAEPPDAMKAVLGADAGTDRVRKYGSRRERPESGPLEVCDDFRGSSRQVVCDLIGNVAEWVADDATLSPLSEALARLNSAAPRVTRGGHFALFAADITPGLRTFHAAHERHPTVGFRVVRDIPPSRQH